MVQYTKENPERIRELQQMYTDWPFFRNFLSNVRMSLFKASMEIAQEYARLCGYVPAITLQSFLQFPLFNSPTLWYDTPQTLFCVQY
jgi:hypothetical protein